jgi:DNA-directed RNA polymerase subunit M/transcription elongation factor TFIIS
MKFCPKCESIMSSVATNTGVMFQCGRCLASVDGTPDDSLLAEGYQESTALQYEKHAAFIETSAFDTAGNKVAKPCPKCNLPYMTMVQIGEQLNTMFTCTCGFRIG